MTQRAAIYARACVDDGHSLIEQVEACREYARDHRLRVVAEYAEAGRGASDLSSASPQLNRALDMARAGEFDVLVVRDAYRLSRCLPSLLAFVEELQNCRVHIEYVWQANCSTLTDRPKKENQR